MSRSYRHTPILKDGGKSSKKNKQLANRYVRRVINRNPALRLKGKQYKRLYETWEINDYTTRFTEKEAINYYYKMFSSNRYWDIWFKEKYPTLEDFLIRYKKDYIYK